MKNKKMDFMILLSGLIVILTIILSWFIFSSPELGRINEISYIILMLYFGAIMGYMLSKFLRKKK